MVISYPTRHDNLADSNWIQSTPSPGTEIHVIGEKKVARQYWLDSAYTFPWPFCGREDVGLGDSRDMGSREQTKYEGTTWHTRTSSLHLISCQPTSHLDMKVVPIEKECDPERIRGGGCCNWGPAGASKHTDDHPGLQIGQERPVTPRLASGKQTSSEKPDLVKPSAKQQQSTPSNAVAGPSNSAQAPPKSTKAARTPKPPKPPKPPKTPKPTKTPTTPTRAPSGTVQEPSKTAPGPSNPSRVPVEPPHPIFPNLPNQLPQRR